MRLGRQRQRCAWEGNGRDVLGKATTEVYLPRRGSLDPGLPYVISMRHPPGLSTLQWQAQVAASVQPTRYQCRCLLGSWGGDRTA